MYSNYSRCNLGLETKGTEILGFVSVKYKILNLSRLGLFFDKNFISFASILLSLVLVSEKDV